MLEIQYFHKKTTRVWFWPFRDSENRSLRLLLGWFSRFRTGQRWMVASNDIFVDQEHYSQNPDM